MNDGSDHPVATNRPLGVHHRSSSMAAQSTSLAGLLERVLDKGIVIAGDITLALATVDILTLKIRLLIASVDKAQEIGINWWQSDPALSSQAKKLEAERDRLQERVARLEARLGIQGEEDDALPPPSTERGRREQDGGTEA